MSTIRPRLARPESLHQQVARNLRNQIEAGVLQHGQSLPSTRELAKEWGTSVFTINQAMKMLTDEGLVVTKPRAGRVVNAPAMAKRQVEAAPNKPVVIFIGGYAGSGKTELGRILARKTRWAMLDKDTLTRPIVEAALELLGQSPHDRESETYLTKVRPREYEALHAAAVENIECGNSVIVTAPFIRELNDSAWIERMKASLVAKDTHPVFVWVRCDADTMHMYIRHRGAARDAAKLASWDAYLAGVNVNFEPPTEHFAVENSASSEPLQEQAERLIQAVHASIPK